MEDNLFNEHVENNSELSSKKSSSRRSVSKSQTTRIAVKQVSRVRRSKIEKQGSGLSQSEVVSLIEHGKHVPYIQDKIEQHNAALSENNNIHVSNHERHNSSKRLSESPSTQNFSTPKRMSAYLIQKAAGEWWNVFPKTDYTYSRFSTCRKEIAPGVLAMPNMSRRAIHTEGSRSPESLHLDHTYSYQCSQDRERVSNSYTNSNHVINNGRVMISNSSVKSTSIVTWIISVFWRMVHSTVSIVTSIFHRTQHIGFESSPVDYAKRESSSFLDYVTYLFYKHVCYYLQLDSWILSLFSRAGHQTLPESTSSQRRLLYLVFLLPLLLAGLLYLCGSDTPTAVVASYTTWLSALPSMWWSAIAMLLPNRTENTKETTSIMKGAILEDKLSVDHSDVDLLVQKVLSSPEFRNALAQSVQSDQEQSQGAVLSAVEQLKQELSEKTQSAMEHKKKLDEHQVMYDHLILENSRMESKIEDLRGQVKILNTNVLSRGTNRCCRRPVYVPKIEIERHVTEFLSGLFGMENGSSTNKTVELKQWLQTWLRAKDDLELRLKNISSYVDNKLAEASKTSGDVIMATISEMVKQEFMKAQTNTGASYVLNTGSALDTECLNCSLTIEQIKKIVNEAISLYDADKTGLVDYALESGGGTVINIRCTENYNDRSLSLSFIGFTFPWSSNHPRNALQPDVHPGQCWAFRGAQGWLMVHLSKRIHVTAFSIEHIPISISSTGNIDAAPKNFSVMGLDHETDSEPLLLGKYMYSNSGPSLQFFPVQTENAPAYQIVELVIESNHGNLNYTCLYRFRVHGIAV